MDPPQQLTTEERFQMFLDAACDYAIFFMDGNGEITEWSNGAEKIIGYSEAEALHLNGREIFLPEDRARGGPEREMAIAVREGQADDERWHLRKDGTRFYAVGRLVALRGLHGEVHGFAKILRDATTTKTLEQALAVSEEHFRATFAQAPIGMALTDLGGRIQEVNAALCRLTGFSEAELVGRELFSLTVPEFREHMRQLTQELLSGQRSNLVLDKQLLRADGSTLWVQNSAALLHDLQERPFTCIDLMQDITPLKRSEAELTRLVDQRTAALEEKRRQMEAFCYTVAHDLRAPLRAIAGYAEFLDQDFSRTLPPEGRAYVQRIEESAARLDRLISDLLGYTRVQQVPLIREEIDLTAIAERVVDQVRRDQPVDGLQVELQRPLGTVHGDRVALEHVFLNLVSNAVKFRRPDVSPRVRLYSEKREDRLRVWVEDNGIGIDPRFRDRVFGMFERLHPESKIPGTGVGLAIVATTMERLGGTRGVEPNHPDGSRFWIEFTQPT